VKQQSRPLERWECGPDGKGGGVIMTSLGGEKNLVEQEGFAPVIEKGALLKRDAGTNQDKKKKKKKKNLPGC